MKKVAKYQSMIFFAMACTESSYDEKFEHHHHSPDPGDEMEIADLNGDFPPSKTPGLPRSFYSTPPYPSAGPIKHPSITTSDAIAPNTIVIHASLPMYKGKTTATNNLITLTIFLRKAANMKEQKTGTRVRIDSLNPIPAETEIIVTRNLPANKPSEQKDSPPSTSPTPPTHPDTIRLGFKDSTDAKTTLTLLDKLDIPWTTASPRSVLGKLFGFRGTETDEQITRAMEPYKAVARSLIVTRHVHSRDIPRCLDDCYYSVNEDETEKLLKVDPRTSTTMHSLSWTHWISPNKKERNCGHCKKAPHETGTCPQAKTQNDTSGYRGACHRCGSFQHSPKSCNSNVRLCTACGRNDHAFYSCPNTIGRYEKLKLAKNASKQNSATTTQSTQTGLRLCWSLKSYAKAATPKTNTMARPNPQPARVDEASELGVIIKKLQAQMELVLQKLEQRDEEIRNQQQQILALEQRLQQQQQQQPVPTNEVQQQQQTTTSTLPTLSTLSTLPVLTSSAVPTPSSNGTSIHPPTPRKNRNSGNAPQHLSTAAGSTIVDYFHQTEKPPIPPKPSTAPTVSGKRKKSTSTDPQPPTPKASTPVTTDNLYEMLDVEEEEDDENKYNKDLTTPGNLQDIEATKRQALSSILPEQADMATEQNKSKRLKATAHKTGAKNGHDGE
jgi:hypothetical protein